MFLDHPLAPSPGLRPTSPPGGEVLRRRGCAPRHLSLWGRGRREAAGEGAFEQDDALTAQSPEQGRQVEGAEAVVVEPALQQRSGHKQLSAISNPLLAISFLLAADGS